MTFRDTVLASLVADVRIARYRCQSNDPPSINIVSVLAISIPICALFTEARQVPHLQLVRLTYCLNTVDFHCALHCADFPFWTTPVDITAWHIEELPARRG